MVIRKDPRIKFEFGIIVYLSIPDLLEFQLVPIEFYKFKHFTSINHESSLLGFAHDKSMKIFMLNILFTRLNWETEKKWKGLSLHSPYNYFRNKFDAAKV